MKTFRVIYGESSHESMGFLGATIEADRFTLVDGVYRFFNGEECVGCTTTRAALGVFEADVIEPFTLQGPWGAQ
jgi:hypothetical protein